MTDRCYRPTYDHSLRVATMARLAMERSGGRTSAKPAKILGALFSGFGHDIGKEDIDPAVLNFPGKYNDHQRAEMAWHPMLGRVTLLRKVDELQAEGHPLAPVFGLMAANAEDHHDYSLRKPKDDSLAARREFGLLIGTQLFDRFDGMTSRLEEREYLGERLAEEDGLAQVSTAGNGRKVIVHDFEGIIARILEDYPQSKVPVYGWSPKLCSMEHWCGFSQRKLKPRSPRAGFCQLALLTIEC